jgi:hypothetical protein
MKATTNSAIKQFKDRFAQELFEKMKGDSKKSKFLKDHLSAVHKLGDDFSVAFDNSLKAEQNNEFKENVFSKMTIEDIYCISCLWKSELLPLENSAITFFNPSQANKDLKMVATGDSSKQYDGICIVETPDNSLNIGSEDSEKVFSLHSVGKVFTGILMCDLISKGVVPEESLHKIGIELEEDIKSQLPKSVQEQLTKVSLHQLMIHKANLPDYLDNYMREIEEKIDNRQKPDSPKEPQDFIKFFDEMKFDEKGNVKANSYSNIGILIAGLVALQHYNKDKEPSEKLTYSQMLREVIINPAGMDNFSETPPENALFSDKSKSHKHICGSPAGGYWTNGNDMKKFAEFIANRWQDKGFRDAIKEYGQEFYDSKKQTISHRGELGLGEQTSSYFSLHLPSKTTCVVASNSDYSGFLGEKISGLIAKEQQQIGRSRTMNALDLESTRREPLSTIKASQSVLVAGKSRGNSNEV